MEIQNSNHEHRLVLKGIWPHSVKPGRGIICNANECCQEVDRHLPYYVCEKCNYYLHYLCAEPSFRQFKYLFHDHLLTLRHAKNDRTISCRVCDHPCESSSFYSCDTCNLEIHVMCALKTPTITFKSKQEVDGGQHLCHKKEMKFVKIKHGKGKVDKYSCRICELPLSSTKVYSCRICWNFFHRSCIESSPEITHPFHSSHSLQVTFFTHGKNTNGGKCGSCCKTYPNHFFFYCGPCKIYICAGCIFSRVPTSLKYQGHDHPLYFIEKIPDDTDHVDCGASRPYCKQMVASDELTNLQRYMFRCIDCKFDLHFLCGPLPCSINHSCHNHPLVLFDWIVEDDSGEYCCDVCESERDPRICVYYCAKCNYFAHVQCVISEVVRVLKEDPRDVNKLRILGQRELVIAMEHNDIVRLENYKRGLIVEEDNQIQDHEPTQMDLSDLIISLQKQELEKLELDHIKLRNLIEGNYNSIRIPIWKPLDRDSELYTAISGLRQRQINNRDANRSGPSKKENEKNEREALESKMSSVMALILERENSWHENEIGPQDIKIQLQEQELSHYSDEHYAMLVKKLKKCQDTSWWTNLTFHELKLKMVNVEGCMITWNLVHVMKHLLAKYGDISPLQPLGRLMVITRYEDMLSPEMKSLVYFLICRLLNSMSETLVVDITEHLLANWYSCLQFVKYKGFEVGFINSRLHQVTRAYFALQASRVENDAKTTLRKEIANLEAKLKRCKELLHGYEGGRGISKPKSKLLEECSNEASRLKLKKVGDSLF